MQTTPPHELPDAALINAVHSHVTKGRHALAQLLLCLYQVEKRLLHAEKGFGSLFAYVRHLGFSEGESWRRVAAARVVGTFPEALVSLVEERLSLTTLSMLRRHLNAANGNALLREVEGLGKAEVEALLTQRGHGPASKLAPRLRPVVVQQHRRSLAAAPAQGSLLEAPQQPFTSPAAALEPSHGQKALGLAAPHADAAGADHKSLADDDGRAGQVGPTAPVPKIPACVYILQVTLTAESRAALQQAQCLLRHRLPQGDYNDIVAMALQELVAKLERAKACKLKKAAAPAAQALSLMKTASVKTAGGAESDSSKSAQPPRKASTVGVKTAAGPGLDSSKLAQPPRVASTAGSQTSMDSASFCSAAKMRHKTKRSDTPPAGKRSRAIPRAVRRSVYKRDGGFCAYMASDGL